MQGGGRGFEPPRLHQNSEHAEKSGVSGKRALDNRIARAKNRGLALAEGRLVSGWFAASVEGFRTDFPAEGNLGREARQEAGQYINR